MLYIRKQFATLKERILEPRKFIQVLAGPRQVGKSTLVGQVLEQVEIPNVIEMAEELGYDVYYWREPSRNKGEKDKEVDFIIDNGHDLTAIEVNSGRRGTNAGLPAFVETFHPKRAFVVGTGGVSLEDFLNCDIESFL